MTKDEIMKKNLDLHSEWMKYAFENPDVLDKIPKGAVLVILPEDDRELYEENYKILEENKKRYPCFCRYYENAKTTNIQHRDYSRVNSV